MQNTNTIAMLVLNHLSQLKSLQRPCIQCAVGVFDGIHLGHRKIIDQMTKSAGGGKGTSVVITFDRHPYQVLNPTIHIPILTRPEQKLALLDSLGIDICVLIKFTKGVASIPPEIWIKDFLWHQMKMDTIFTGEDSFFGKEGKGNIHLLKQWSSKLGFSIHQVNTLRIEKSPVSSTIIRNYIAEGNLPSAKKFLGRPYSIVGKIIPGAGRGRKLGFPTFNLSTENHCLPPAGVYAVQASIVNFVSGIIRTQRSGISAVANLGQRPTFKHKNTGPLLEVHFLDGQNIEEITGQACLEITWLRKIREETAFPSPAKLRAQIEKDVATAKSFFSLCDNASLC